MQSHRYGKMESRMSTPATKAFPAPPNAITALRGGFNAIANQAYIILIPVLLDLWLWLGPHLQIKQLMTNLLEAVRSAASLETPSSENLLQVNPEMVEEFAQRINLMTTLRSYPVGIPSLISGILPIDGPLGSPLVIDITSPWTVITLFIVLTLIGTLAGTFYFMVIAQAALSGKVNWKQSIKEFPRMAMQMVALTLAIGVLLIVLLVPTSCVFSFISMGGIPVTTITVLVLAGMLLWVVFPLIFTPFGIFASHINLLAAIQRSIALTRMTMPNTLLFLGIIVIVSQGLDFLWRVPQEGSWLTLVGLAGHGFVASGLLAAIFVYYRDADAWVQKVIREMYSKQVS